MSKYPPEYRPYRVAIYIAYFVFTLGFIGLVTRSVWNDLYGQPARGAEPGRPTIAACADDLETLNRDLQTRLSAPLAPHTARASDDYAAEWDAFTWSFEDRLRRVQARCIDNPPQGAETGPVRDAMAKCVDQLDALRQQLARCGLDGESDRKQVAAAIAELRLAAGKAGQ